MVIIDDKISTGREQILKEDNASLDYGYVVNGIIDLVNDVQTDQLGKKPEFYVRKIEGYSEHLLLTGVTGISKGSFMFVDPDTTKSNRSQMLVAYNDSIYAIQDGVQIFLRDVNTSDGYSITRLVGNQWRQFANLVIGDSTMSAEIYRYQGEQTGAITAVSDAGGGQIDLDSTAHGFVAGNRITVSGTTDYNATYTVDSVPDADTIRVTATWTSDQTGTWTGLQLSLETETAMNAARVLGFMDETLVAGGIGANQSSALYSETSVSGEFSDFTSDTGVGDGGELSGILNTIRSMDYISGYCVVAEENRVTFHERKIETDLVLGVVKKSNTIEKLLTLNDIGTRSLRGLLVSGSLFVLDDVRKTVFQYTISSRPKLQDQAKDLTPTFKNYDFSNGELLKDPDKNLLLVRCSSITGGLLDTTLLYNFKTESWSIDPDKNFRDMQFDPILRKIFAFDQTATRMVEVFDGGYSNLGKPITVKWRTNPINGGTEYVEKDFESASVKFGYLDESQSVDIKYYVDEKNTPDATDSFSVGDVENIKDESKAGASGKYVSGSGGTEFDSRMTFKRRIFEGAVDNSSRLIIEINETSYAPFLAYKTRVRVSQTDNESDDYLQ